MPSCLGSLSSSFGTLRIHRTSRTRRPAPGSEMAARGAEPVQDHAMTGVRFRRKPGGRLRRDWHPGRSPATWAPRDWRENFQVDELRTSPPTSAEETIRPCTDCLEKKIAQNRTTLVRPLCFRSPPAWTPARVVCSPVPCGRRFAVRGDSSVRCANACSTAEVERSASPHVPRPRTSNRHG